MPSLEKITELPLEFHKALGGFTPVPGNKRTRKPTSVLDPAVVKAVLARLPTRLGPLSAVPKVSTEQYRDEH